MKRTKLQMLVRETLAVNTPSTEGFLGDVISSIKVGLGLKRRPILSDRETRKESDMRSLAVKRLKKTVLDRKWLDQATFVQGELSHEHSQALQFPGATVSDDLLEPLKYGIKQLSKFDDVYSECVRKHVVKVNEILEDLESSINIDDFDPDFDFAADNACDELDRLETPKRLIGTFKLNMFNNEVILITNGIVEVRTLKSIVPKLKLLNKEQAITVAEHLVEFLENGGLFPKTDAMVSEYASYFNSELHEVLIDTHLYNEYLWENFEKCWYINEIFKHERHVVFALLSWLNASVK